jgi:hypothetical protein
MLSVITLSVAFYLLLCRVVMPSNIMLNVILLNVVMISVVAPLYSLSFM